VQKPRCLVIFEESIKSAETKKAYFFALEKFRKWADLGNHDDLLEADEKSIQRLLEDYVISLKGKISPNTFNTRLAPIFLFYQVNDVNINKVRIKKMFPAKVKRSGYSAYSREHIQKMLNTARSKRTKACILIMASTGCRSGALADLKMKDIQDYKDGCKIVTFYSGDPSEYVGFLTPEASKVLDDYLDERIQNHERIEPEFPLIREDYRIGSVPPKPINRYMLESMIEITQKDGQRKKDSSGRYNIPITGGFRKFFNSVMKLRNETNLSLCEKLMGHSVTIGLDNHYLPASNGEIFSEFRKAIPELTISDVERKQTLIESQKKEITELEKREEKIKELTEQVQEIKNQQFETQKVLSHSVIEGIVASLAEWERAGGKIPIGKEKAWERQLKLEHDLFREI